MAWGGCPLHSSRDPRGGQPPVPDLGVSLGPPTLEFLQACRLLHPLPPRRLQTLRWEGAGGALSSSLEGVGPG